MKAARSCRSGSRCSTVSDTRTAADDRSGDTLVERLTGAGHVLADREILRDDRAAIAARLRRWIADPGST